MLSTILTVTFLALMFFRVPVSLAIGLSTIIPILLTGRSFATLPQFMTEGVNSTALLAVPFFILAGNLFSSLGLSRRVFDFARHIVGHLKGGMGLVMIVANMIFAGISGSALADAAALGIIGIPEMEKMGYRRQFSTAITLCSSVVGPIIPPSVAFIIYGVISGASIGRLFLGGIGPGIVIGICLMIVVYYYGARGIEPLPVQPRKTLWEIGRSFVRNFPTLAVPAIILVGMGGGVVTPTEVGVLALVYALCLGLFYRETSFKELINALKVSVTASSLIMYITAISMVAGWVYAYERTPQKLADLMLTLTTNKYILLFLINVFLLILGCLLETIPALILTTPIFMPMIHQLGIDPVHFGVIICYNLVIGIVTPPMGMGLYVMVAIVDIKFEDLIKACIPLLIPLIFALFLITYIPQLTLFLPNLVFGSP